MQNKQEDISLHQAIQNNDLEQVKTLLATEGISVNAKDKLGNTPLHLAAKNGNTEIVQALLENKKYYTITAIMIGTHLCTWQRKMATLK